MTYFAWNEKYSVHIREIDEQHKKLVALINELFEAMKTGQGQEILGKVIAGLITYTKSHFATEERLMRDHGYAEYLVHKQVHDSLTKKVLELNGQFQAGQTALTIQVSNFLKDWLTNHILGTDKKYSAFLNSKGVN